MEMNLGEQSLLQSRDYQLASEAFKVHEQLYKNKVIPLLDFKQEESKLLAKELPLRTLFLSIVQNSSAQATKQKEILEFDNTMEILKIDFIESIRTLKSAIDSWKYGIC